MKALILLETWSAEIPDTYLRCNYGICLSMYNAKKRWCHTGHGIMLWRQRRRCSFPGREIGCIARRLETDEKGTADVFFLLLNLNRVLWQTDELVSKMRRPCPHAAPLFTCCSVPCRLGGALYLRWRLPYKRSAPSSLFVTFLATRGSALSWLISALLATRRPPGHSMSFPLVDFALMATRHSWPRRMRTHVVRSRDADPEFLAGSGTGSDSFSREAFQLRPQLWL